MVVTPTEELVEIMQDPNLDDFAAEVQVLGQAQAEEEGKRSPDATKLAIGGTLLAVGAVGGVTSFVKWRRAYIPRTVTKPVLYNSLVSNGDIKVDANGVITKFQKTNTMTGIAASFIISENLKVGHKVTGTVTDAEVQSAVKTRRNWAIGAGFGGVLAVAGLAVLANELSLAESTDPADILRARARNLEASLWTLRAEAGL